MRKVIYMLAFLALLAESANAAISFAFVDIDTTMKNFEVLKLNEDALREINEEIRKQLRDNLPKEFEIITMQTVKELKGNDFIENSSQAINLGKKLKAKYVAYASLSYGYKLTLEVYETENGTLVSVAEPIFGQSFRDEFIPSIRANAGSVCDKVRERESGNYLRPFVPGLAQIRKNYPMFGAAIITTEAVALGAGIFLTVKAISKNSEMNDAKKKIESAETQSDYNKYVREYDSHSDSYEKYKDRAFLSFGAAIGIYAINILTGYVMPYASPSTPSTSSVSITPMVSPSGQIMANAVWTLNF